MTTCTEAATCHFEWCTLEPQQHEWDQLVDVPDDLLRSHEAIIALDVPGVTITVAQHEHLDGRCDEPVLYLTATAVEYEELSIEAALRVTLALREATVLAQRVRRHADR